MRVSPTALAFLAVALFAGRVAATELKLARSDATPPTEVAMTLRASLAPVALRIVGADKPLLELWLRKDLPLRATPSSEAGVSYPELQEGTLVGAVQVLETWSDYRGRKIKPGAYTLRYAVQPSDGNHTGITEYRDFLILLPVAADTDLAASYTSAELAAFAKKSTGFAHPAVMGLFPAGEAIAPTVTKNDLDQPMLAVKAGAITLGLVVEGRAEAEGY